MNRHRVERLYAFWARSRLYDPLMRLGFLGRERWLRRRAIEALALWPGAAVLDLCTGSGANLPDLARAVGARGRVVGVDISAEMLRRARERHDLGGNVELVETDASNLLFPDASFDAVISTFGFSVVPDPEVVAAEAVRVLRPVGKISIADARSLSGPLPGLRRLTTRLVGPLFAWERQRDYASLLTARGLNVRRDIEQRNLLLVVGERPRRRRGS